MFGDIFGGSRGRSDGVSRGSDLRYNLNLTLEQAVGGDTIEIKIPVMTACADCDGTGCAPGSSPTTCPDCNGTGQIRVSQGFSLFNKRAQGAGAREESSRIPVVPAEAVAALKKARLCRLRFLLVSIMGTALG